MKRILLTLLTLVNAIGLHSTRVNAQEFNRAFSESNPWLDLLEPRATSSLSFGVKFGGISPFENRSTSEFKPASTAKVITAAVALQRLGADYQFETRVQWRVDPAQPGRISGLTIEGSGDPTWGLSELGEKADTKMKELALHLQSQGVKEVQGPLRFTTTDSRWSSAGVPEGWKASDLVACYGALAGPFQIGLNCMPFIVTGKNEGKWSDFRIQDPVQVKVTLGSSNALWLKRESNGTFTVHGTLANGKTGAVAIPVVRVDQWLEKILKGQLSALGIQITAGAPYPGNLNISGNASSSASISKSYTLRSVPLKRLIQPFLKYSFNLMGEALLLKLGEKAGASSSTSLRDAGLSVIQDALQSMGAQDSVKLHDGSGLSRLATATPSAFYQVLHRITELEGFSELLNGLSVAGSDGTLRRRMVGTRAAKFFRGKTGTLNGVSNVVGYFPVQDGSWVPVVILGQSSIGGAPLKQGADRVIVRLAEMHRPASFGILPVMSTPDSDLMHSVNPFESHGFPYDPRSSEGMTDSDEAGPSEILPDASANSPSLTR